MLQAVLDLPDGDRRALVRTRTAVLLDLDEATWMRLMGTHMAVLEGLGPEAMMREMATIQAIVPDLPPAKQAAIEMMLAQMQGGGMAMGGSSAAPAHAMGPAAPGKPWWKFWG